MTLEQIENRIKHLNNVRDVMDIVDALPSITEDTTNVKIALMKKVINKVTRGDGEATLMCRVLDMRLKW